MHKANDSPAADILKNGSWRDAIQRVAQHPSFFHPEIRSPPSTNGTHSGGSKGKVGNGLREHDAKAKEHMGDMEDVPSVPPICVPRESWDSKAPGGGIKFISDQVQRLSEQMQYVTRASESMESRISRRLDGFEEFLGKVVSERLEPAVEGLLDATDKLEYSTPHWRSQEDHNAHGPNKAVNFNSRPGVAASSMAPERTGNGLDFRPVVSSALGSRDSEKSFDMNSRNSVGSQFAGRNGKLRAIHGADSSPRSEGSTPTPRLSTTQSDISNLWPLWTFDEPVVPVNSAKSAGFADNGGPGNPRATRIGVGVNIRLREISSLAKGEHVSKIVMTSTSKEKPVRSHLNRYVLHPTGRFVLMWLILAPILLLYDIVMIPMQAFPLPQSPAWFAISLLVACYWSCDLVRCFFTGFELSNGEGVEMRIEVIAVTYLRTWFLLDLPTICVDWLFIVLGSGGSFNKFWRTSRAVRAWRILRVVRLVRVLKVIRSSLAFIDGIQSLQKLIILRSLSIGILVLFMSHYMACYWYTLGDPEGTAGGAVDNLRTTWLKDSDMMDASFSELYTTSVHWALSQSGFSSCKTYPTNNLERMFASMCGYVWMIITSLIICFFHSWYQQLRDMTTDQLEQDVRLRKYLEEHSVSKNLAYRIMRCFRWNYKVYMRRVREEDVEFLRDLPPVLQVAMHTEIYIPLLARHIYFKVFSLTASGDDVLICVAHLAMSEYHYVSEDVAFLEGGCANWLYYVGSGNFDYYAVYNHMEHTAITQGTWACEPAVWLKWTLRGRLQAKTSSELTGVNVEKLLVILEDQEKLCLEIDYLRQFATKLVRHFMEADPDTDLWHDEEAVTQICKSVFGDVEECTFQPSSSATRAPVRLWQRMKNSTTSDMKATTSYRR